MVLCWMAVQDVVRGLADRRHEDMIVYYSYVKASKNDVDVTGSHCSVKR